MRRVLAAVGHLGPWIGFGHAVALVISGVAVLLHHHVRANPLGAVLDSPTPPTMFAVMIFGLPIVVMLLIACSIPHLSHCPSCVVAVFRHRTEPPPLQWAERFWFADAGRGGKLLRVAATASCVGAFFIGVAGLIVLGVVSGSFCLALIARRRAGRHASIPELKFSKPLAWVERTGDGEVVGHLALPVLQTLDTCPYCGTTAIAVAGFGSLTSEGAVAASALMWPCECEWTPDRDGRDLVIGLSTRGLARFDHIALIPSRAPRPRVLVVTRPFDE